jgi:deoxyxylulose-5-phosphate synthase
MTQVVRILDSIDSPADLHRLSVDGLRDLAAEIREEIVNTVKQTGGPSGRQLGCGGDHSRRSFGDQQPGR